MCTSLLSTDHRPVTSVFLLFFQRISFSPALKPLLQVLPLLECFVFLSWHIWSFSLFRSISVFQTVLFQALGALQGLSEAPRGWQEGLERFPMSRTGRSPWPSTPGFHHSNWTFLSFISFCFGMISFGPKVPGVKSVCKLLT